MMKIFRDMVNDCIKIEIHNNASSLKRLSQFSYHQMSKYDVASYYKLHAIAKAAGILATRKKSIARGIATKNPYFTKLNLVSSYGFKLVGNSFKIPLGRRNYFEIPLADYVKRNLSDPNMMLRSFTLTPEKIVICYSKLVRPKPFADTIGVDRNLRNVTVGNQKQVIRYDLSKTVNVIETTTSIVRSFKRNDSRIRKKITKKYGVRKHNKINDILHNVSKKIVEYADNTKTGIVFEDIRGIGKLYRKNNKKGREYRRKMNSWSFAEIKRQIEYKAEWIGIPIIQLTSKETKGTSTLCPRCGERLQVGQKMRSFRCVKCKREMDRDVVAAMNISYRGLARLASSKGSASEAMVQEPNLQKLVILKVDADKSIWKNGIYRSGKAQKP